MANASTGTISGTGRKVHTDLTRLVLLGLVISDRFLTAFASDSITQFWHYSGSNFSGVC